jgi:hypothetical protein
MEMKGFIYSVGDRLKKSRSLKGQALVRNRRKNPALSPDGFGSTRYRKRLNVVAAHSTPMMNTNVNHCQKSLMCPYSHAVTGMIRGSLCPFLFIKDGAKYMIDNIYIKLKRL